MLQNISFLRFLRFFPGAPSLPAEICSLISMALIHVLTPPLLLLLLLFFAPIKKVNIYNGSLGAQGNIGFSRLGEVWETLGPSVRV